MNEGKTGRYWWIEGTDFRLHDLVVACPELLRGKTVAITSFDSGPLVPSSGESRRGWHANKGVLYAPDVDDPRELPHEHYDEWYIFDIPSSFEPDDRYVNYGDFFLRDPSYQLREADPTWDKVGITERIEHQQERQLKFWKFVERIAPRSFVLDGERLIFGSRVQEDLQRVRKLAADASANRAERGR